MKFEVGDIVIDPDWFGHAMMIYAEGDDTKAWIIHGKNDGDFHIVPNMTEKGLDPQYLIKGTMTVFRPPPFDALHKATLITVADTIKTKAKYGIYRAVRLWAGSSTFGSDAAERLDKYRYRFDIIKNNPPGGKYFVTTITCSEAVILCYQLTFAESDPQFIHLDAAHTMPCHLGEWLSKATGWKTIQKGTK
jgi:hypothetical protein